MPIFIGVHKLPETLSENEILEGWNGYKQEASKRGLRPIRVHYSLAKGVAYCETEAPSENDVREAHEGLKIPLEDVLEVKTSD